MKPLKQLAVALLGALLLIPAAQAQEQYQLQLRGSIYSTNEVGELVKQPFNQKTLIAECINDLGMTNKPKLTLVYLVNGDLNGDVIQVIGSRTGQVFCEKLRLLFPVTLASADESSVTQLVYVFSDQQSEEVGRGIVTRTTTSNGKTRISGNLNFYLPENGTNGVRICTATFNTSKLVSISD